MVAPGTPVAEIETEKALVEYQAEAGGIVGRLVLAEGESGEIGDPILVLVAAGETDAAVDAVLGTAAPAAASAVAAAAVNEDQPPAPSPAPVPVARVFASPLVRKLAAGKGVDFTALEGTGPNGRVTRRDLERALAAPAPAPALDQ